MKKIKEFFIDGNFETFSFHAISTDFSFFPSEDGKARMEVKISGFEKDVSDYKPIFKTNGKRVDIFMLRRRMTFEVTFFEIRSTRFLKVLSAKVWLPRGVSLEFKGTSGDLSVENVSCEDTNITTVSGDVRIRNGVHKRMVLKSTSGDLRVEGTELDFFNAHSVSGDLFLRNLGFKISSLRTISGDVKMENMKANFEEMNVKTVSGDVNMILDGKPSAHFDFSSVSGKVIINDKPFEGRKRNIIFETTEKPFSSVTLESVSGDVKVFFPNDIPSPHEETEELLRDILKDGRATLEEVKELMLTLGYSEEEIKNFFNEEEER